MLVINQQGISINHISKFCKHYFKVLSFILLLCCVVNLLRYLEAGAGAEEEAGARARARARAGAGAGAVAGAGAGEGANFLASTIQISRF